MDSERAESGEVERVANKRANRARSSWPGTLDDMLKQGYASGWRGKREVIKEILRQCPELPRHVIWKRASRLGLTQKRQENVEKTQHGHWSADEDKLLLQLCGEYPARMIGEKLHRSERAVRLRLLRLAGSSSFRDGYKQTEVSRDLGVSPATVRRWVVLGWLNLRGRRITDRSFRQFCREHGSEINFDNLRKDMKSWLREEMGLITKPDVKVPEKWYAMRKHALRVRSCPRCAREIRGNAYYRHVKTCRGKVGRVPGGSDSYF
jgi:hypothetical protein